MTAPFHIREVTTPRDLRAFVTLPWRVHKGDPHWVAPLMPERLSYLNPEQNPFYKHAEVALLLACRGRQVVGTIAPFVNHRAVDHLGEQHEHPPRSRGLHQQRVPGRAD
jgi:hypothetical protein